MTDAERLDRKLSGLAPWKDDLSFSGETRGPDGLSLYDLSLANAAPCEKQTAIIVTAWAGQLKWLEAVLASYRATGAYVVLAFDQHYAPWVKPDPEDALRALPNPRHYQLAHSVVYKHQTFDANKRNGWFWNVRYAQGLLRQFPQLRHVYVTNGDCVWDQPEGLPDLLELGKPYDLISGQTSPSGTIHTANVIFTAEAFHRIVDYMAELMYTPVLGSRSAETILREAVSVLQLRLGIPPSLPLDKDGTVDCYARYDQDSTWKQLMGFKNLFAIYETIGNEGREVMGLRPYADPYRDWLYWSGEERETVCQYWATGDRRHLMRWLDRWEDSDYNRLYYPLDYYGTEPIYADAR